MSGSVCCLCLCFFWSFEGYSYHFFSGTLACLGGEEKQIFLMVRDIVKSSEEFRNLIFRGVPIFMCLLGFRSSHNINIHDAKDNP